MNKSCTYHMSKWSTDLRVREVYWCSTSRFSCQSDNFHELGLKITSKFYQKVYLFFVDVSYKENRKFHIIRDGRDSLAAVSVAYPIARRHFRSSLEENSIFFSCFMFFFDRDAFIISESEIGLKLIHAFWRFWLQELIYVEYQ